MARGRISLGFLKSFVSLGLSRCQSTFPVLDREYVSLFPGELCFLVNLVWCTHLGRLDTILFSICVTQRYIIARSPIPQVCSIHRELTSIFRSIKTPLSAVGGWASTPSLGAVLTTNVSGTSSLSTASIARVTPGWGQQHTEQSSTAKARIRQQDMAFHRLFRPAAI